PTRGARRAEPRALRRAAVGIAAHTGRLPRRVARRGLAAVGAQQRARFVVRVQRRRRGRGGGRALPGGAPRRRGAHARSGARVRDVLVATSAVPGFGWRSYRVVEGEGPATAVRAAGLTLENEHVRAVVDPSDGTLTVTRDGLTAAGHNRYVDGGDGGDTYNYS